MEKNGTVMDYLRWRGDLTFAQDGFNEVDDLVLCIISYLNFRRFDDLRTTDPAKAVALPDVAARLTEEDEQAIAAANAARQAVLSDAATFEPVLEDENDMDEIHRGLDASGNVVGYTGKITTRGYGGPIEVTVGLSADGTITGVNVGGTEFAETAGLGAKVKEAWFGEQFAGLSAPVALAKNGGEIDAVSSATISSTAVTTAVNDACAAIMDCMEGR